MSENFFFRATSGAEYFFFNEFMQVDKAVEHDSKEDEARFLIGNYFPDEQSAREKISVLRMLLRNPEKNEPEEERFPVRLIGLFQIRELLLNKLQLKMHLASIRSKLLISAPWQYYDDPFRFVFGAIKRNPDGSIAEATLYETGFACFSEDFARQWPGCEIREVERPW